MHSRLPGCFTRVSSTSGTYPRSHSPRMACLIPTKNTLMSLRLSRPRGVILPGSRRESAPSSVRAPTPGPSAHYPGVGAALKGARTGSIFRGRVFHHSRISGDHVDLASVAVFTLRTAHVRHDEAQSRNAQRTARHTYTGSHTLYTKLVQHRSRPL